MGILSFDDEEHDALPDRSAPPLKVHPNYSTITTDTREIDPAAMSAFMRGANWPLKSYYQQVLKADNNPRAQSLETPAIYQQYRRIDKLVLKLEGSINYSMDDAVRTMDASGTGSMMAVIHPNVGDMFIAEAGDNKYGVYAVTQVTRTSILRNSIFRLEFKMVSWLNEERDADFKEKTIDTVVFDANGWLNGCGPFTTDAEAANVANYKDLLKELLDQYLCDFWSAEHETLIVPDQGAKALDVYVIRFLFSLFNRSDDKRLMQMQRPNVSTEVRVDKAVTLWDALRGRKEHLLRSCSAFLSLTDMRYFRGSPELQGIGYLGIPFLVAPIEPSSNVQDQYDYRDMTRWVAVPFSPGRPRRRIPVEGDYITDTQRSEYLPSKTNNGTIRPPKILPVTADGYYVFSEAFYEGEGALTLLESITQKAIRKEPFELEHLNLLLDRPDKWTSLERFYYYPVLFYLMSLCIGRLNG